MADRMLYIAWGTPARGAESRALEVFNEALGIMGRHQQEGKIESFDVCLMAPNQELNGFITVRGSAAQISAFRDSEDFIRNTIDAELSVEGMRHIEGWCNEGVAAQMGMYQEAVERTPQRA